MSNANIVNGVLGKREVTSYVDPYPGLAGSEKVAIKSDCSRCGGTGIYVWWNSMGKCQGSCFGCFGTGVVTHERAVSRLRTEAKKDAYYREFAAEIVALHAETDRIQAEADKAAELAQAWDDAHAEQARLAALVQGFVGQIGEKVTVTGTVKVAKYCEAQAYNRSATMFVIVETESGQVIKTSGSGASLFELNRDDVVTLTGTVKDVATYRGQDQTVLFRTKAVVIS